MTRLLPPYFGGTSALGFFVLRLIAGTAMMLHGWPKIQNPTEWMPADAGYPAAALALAAVAEFGGGLCWLVGLLTPVASILILGTMTMAAKMHIGAGDPFVGKGGPGWELAGVYWAIAAFLLLAGPGKLSADYLLFGLRRNRAAVAPPAE